ncbi:hypothetical protein ARMGADRAFT_1161489 [Armillaria gallica]|uniref:FAD-binding domain-containing protein n=1 Tax=Armillaria gallica TaxID=47427 RepID=A0A2H3EIA2_ARMGA|nr:hypothetical protein ARMGADRAFT_1161489 [Armillaria gallica]
MATMPASPVAMTTPADRGHRATVTNMAPSILTARIPPTLTLVPIAPAQELPFVVSPTVIFAHVYGRAAFFCHFADIGLPTLQQILDCSDAIFYGLEVLHFPRTIPSSSTSTVPNITVPSRYNGSFTVAKGAFRLNTGVVDAQNLAWRLGALCKGIAKPALLNSYDVERREDALRAPRRLTIVVPSPGEDEHVAFFRQFTVENTGFLIGFDLCYGTNALNKSSITGIPVAGTVTLPKLIVFTNLVSKIKARLQMLDSYLASSRSFYQRYTNVDLVKASLASKNEDTPSLGADYYTPSSSLCTVYLLEGYVVFA